MFLGFNYVVHTNTKHSLPVTIATFPVNLLVATASPEAIFNLRDRSTYNAPELLWNCFLYMPLELVSTSICSGISVFETSTQFHTHI